MAVLPVTDYNDTYFGLHPTLHHEAGYTKYSRIQYNRKSTGVNHTIEDSRGTVFGEMAQDLNINGRFIGKDVLVLGCAFGYLVKELRDMGVLAEGIDVSPEAIAQADPSISSYVRVENAITSLQAYKKNAYNFIVTKWYLECVDDADLPVLISNMNRITKNDQLHIVYPNTNPTWYNVKTLAEWQQQPFKTGTIILNGNDFSDYVTVIN